MTMLDHSADFDHADLFDPPSPVPANLPDSRPALLDPGFNLTLRPMRYPQFYDMYRDAIRNTWT
ncbi:MAG TPA: hypothetical protein PLS46_04505, partial [Microthrixaceae bacterium]|nr:hypothetical protein [Microthrixaceae bacterium]